MHYTHLISHTTHINAHDEKRDRRNNNELTHDLLQVKLTHSDVNWHVFVMISVIATSAVPIGKNTLRYGSCDGGLTVHAADPKLNALMEEAGTSQNTTW